MAWTTASLVGKPIAVNVNWDQMGRVNRHEVNTAVVLSIDALRDHVGRVGVIDGARLEGHLVIRRGLEVVELDF